MKLQEIILALETVAPRRYQESYDNSGLITGDPQSEITKALCTLDCTEAVIDEAIAKGCNLVVAHHPIVFKGLKSLTGANYVERTVIKAIRNHIAIYAIHTNLDNVWQGVNRKIGEKLGLKNLRILSPKANVLEKLHTFVPHANAPALRDALFAAGAGHIGDYDRCSFNVEGTGTFRGSESSSPYVGEAAKEHEEHETKVEVVYPTHTRQHVISALRSAHPYEEVAFDIVALGNAHPRLGSGMIGELEKPQDETDFLRHVSKQFHTTAIRHTALCQRPVQTVAFCGGSGQFLLQNAIHQNADVFISADFKYHEYFDAEDKLLIVDIGHYESEQFTSELLKEILVEKFPTFAVLLSEVKTNPVHYFIS